MRSFYPQPLRARSVECLPDHLGSATAPPAEVARRQARARRAACLRLPSLPSPSRDAFTRDSLPKPRHA